MNRLYNLDYLRGLAAFGIMIFHYLSWSLGKFTADTFMGRIGIYGVSIFYILSGLTLHYVYSDKLKFTVSDIGLFFKKRIFRIFPLLWLVTLLSLILNLKFPNLFDLFLNLSGLFGFIKWDTYYSVGVWSIGNELVFYSFFPAFVLFSRDFKILFVSLWIVLLSLYLYFTFAVLSPNSTLSEQWRDYINPLNQVFLFFAGFLIGQFLSSIQLKNSTSFILLFLGVMVFVLYPESGDPINLVCGIDRLIFTVCCLMICAGFFKLHYKFPKIIDRPLALLGEASYSVYLLHPIVFSIFSKVSVQFSTHNLYFPTWVKLLLSVSVTLLSSYYVYQYFEKYFMRIGRSKKPNKESS